MTNMPFRPTFWNIPLEGQICLYVLGVAAVACCAWGIWQAVKGILAFSNRKPASHKRERLHLMLNEAFLHTRIAKTPAGKAHFCILWGFILLFFGTVIATIDWDVTRLFFGYRFLGGQFYLIYKLILDLAGIATLGGLGYAAWTRWGQKHVSLEASPRFACLIGFLAFIIISGFFAEALRLAVQEPVWASWSPIGNTIACLFFKGLPEDLLSAAHSTLWWIHALSALAFIALLPRNFFSHSFLAPWNIYEQKLEPKGALPKIENIEEQESFGISKFEQLSWKHLLDFNACTECARCSDVCPAVKMNTPLNPKNVVLKLREAYQARMKGNLSKIISEDELWSCSTCGACMNACPSRINLPDLIVQMRSHYALEEGKFPKGVANTLQNIASVGNPWGLDPGSRLGWASGLDVPVMEPGKPVEILYWVGCAASYDRRAQNIARSMVNILKAAGISFGIMTEERCLADAARRLGEEYLFQTAAAENIEYFSQYSFKKILCACPHCFNTLANEYPQFDGGKFDVVSHVEFILDLIQASKLPKIKKESLPAAYQDPCYLARYNNITEAPRQILSELTTETREPRNSGVLSTCCGAGGGQFWSDGSKTQRINVIRFKELKETKAATIATACPFCLSMMTSAKSQLKDESTDVQDIAELVAAALSRQGPEIRQA